MNNSDSENDRVNNFPNNFQNDRAKNNSHEIDQRLSGNECPFRILGWDSNGNPIPKEQAQLIDSPKSSSVNLTQQQSQVSSPNMQKTEDTKNNSCEINQRLSGNECPFRIFGWDSSGKKIPEEQEQLVDLPKSSSVTLTQQQSQQQPPLPINYNGSLNNNNQAVLPISNPNQVGFVSPSYYPNQCSYLIPVDDSAINRQDALNNLEIEKQWEIARIEILRRCFHKRLSKV